MPITALDHYTIAARDLDRSVAFYETALGLERGPRPAFDFPGAWLYAGDHPVVHLFVADAPGESSPDAPGEAGTDAPGEANTGALDHIAFRAEGLAATRERLDALGIVYRQQTVPGTTLHQVFITDPDGLRIELNFDEG
jgi:catechol 2,3-dioxygenase-like lactoylglutathione lyase family enzyme